LKTKRSEKRLNDMERNGKKEMAGCVLYRYNMNVASVITGAAYSQASLLNAVHS